MTAGFAEVRPVARVVAAAARASAAVTAVLLLVAYLREGALFHWQTHLYTGGGVALAGAAGAAWVRRRPVPSVWAWVVAGHAVAATPDVLFAAGAAHEPWMDVFVLHVSSHRVAGREVTLLVAFLAALAAYFVVLDVLRRRHGSTALFVRTSGDGVPVVLLHGLGASSRYWAGVVRRLPAVRIIAPDLLGFGRSPKPRDGYAASDHVAALARVVPEDAVVVGHSAGAIVAAALAAAHPRTARSLVLVGLPAFPDASTARLELGRVGPLARWSVTRPALAWLLCQLMCAVRPLALAAAPLLVRDVPRAVAADAARHRWRSFRGTLDGVVVGHRVLPDLVAAGRPVVFVHGRSDRDAPLHLVEELAAELRSRGVPAETLVVEGDHHLAVRRPDIVADAIDRALRQGAAATPTG